MVSRSTLTRRGPRLPIGGGRSTGSRTIDIGPSALTTLLTLCANGTRPFAGCAWYVRGLLGSSAALALLPNNRDTEHNSVNCGSEMTDVMTAATITPASAAPIPTITRSFLFFASFMAVAFPPGSFRVHHRQSGPTLFALQQTGSRPTKCRTRASKLHWPVARGHHQASASLISACPSNEFVKSQSALHARSDGSIRAISFRLALSCASMRVVVLSVEQCVERVS